MRSPWRSNMDFRSCRFADASLTISAMLWNAQQICCGCAGGMHQRSQSFRRAWLAQRRASASLGPVPEPWQLSETRLGEFFTHPFPLSRWALHVPTLGLVRLSRDARSMGKTQVSSLVTALSGPHKRHHQDQRGFEQMAAVRDNIELALQPFLWMGPTIVSADLARC